MLKSITWGEYLLFTTTLVVGWYAFILLAKIIKRPKERSDVYSVGKRTDLFDEDSQETADKISQIAEEHIAGKEEDADPADWNLIMQSIMQQVKGIIIQASEDNAAEDQLSAQLRVALVNHQDIRETAYGGMVSEFIVKEASARGYELSEESVLGFWE
jgi:uncharacterized protein YqeY